MSESDEEDFEVVCADVNSTNFVPCGSISLAKERIFTLYCCGSNTRKNSRLGRTFVHEFFEATIGAAIIDGPTKAGINVRERVNEALQAICGAGCVPAVINIVGFSRGAVIAVRIANRLWELYGPTGPLLHIFSADPVAGPGSKGDADAITVPPNVRALVVVLAMHEMRREFECQDLTRTVVMEPEKTAVSFVPLPGEHCTIVRAQNGFVTGSPVHLLSILCYDCLQRWGTHFEREPRIHHVFSPPYLSGEQRRLARKFQSESVDMAPINLLELINGLKQRLAEFFEMGQRSTSTSLLGRRPREFLLRMADYVLDDCISDPDHGVFLNQWEREALKLKYPQLFWANSSQVAGPDQAISELRDTCPATFTFLVEKRGLGSKPLPIFGAEMLRLIHDIPAGDTLTNRIFFTVQQHLLRQYRKSVLPGGSFVALDQLRALRWNLPPDAEDATAALLLWHCEQNHLLPSDFHLDCDVEGVRQRACAHLASTSYGRTLPLEAICWVADFGLRSNYVGVVRGRERFLIEGRLAVGCMVATFRDPTLGIGFVGISAHRETPRCLRFCGGAARTWELKYSKLPHNVAPDITSGHTFVQLAALRKFRADTGCPLPTDRLLRIRFLHCEDAPAPTTGRYRIPLRLFFYHLDLGELSVPLQLQPSSRLVSAVMWAPLEGDTVQIIAVSPSHAEIPSTLHEADCRAQWLAIS
eukprot:TRINITY_DN9298_c0_g1_i1.p1 TRINITY_DN9298_c0_g1~~TRINITY_DN9298_c0_g1_i1.p1  ORF type:complete len:700 (-),score=61.31 TRINITY_DN9298_c0_g1_i1:171-2270(-)